MSTGNGSALLDPRAARQALQAAARHREGGPAPLRARPGGAGPVDPGARSVPRVLEVGPEDASEVVALASPEQFRHFLDLGAWPRRDEGPDPRAVLRWLHLARDGGGQSDRAHHATWTSWRCSTRRCAPGAAAGRCACTTCRRRKSPPSRATDAPSARRRPGTWSSSLPEGGEFGTLSSLLDDLYAEDVLGTTRLLESLRWEVPTELEETARRWRDGRLARPRFPSWRRRSRSMRGPTSIPTRPDPDPTRPRPRPRPRPDPTPTSTSTSTSLTAAGGRRPQVCWSPAVSLLHGDAGDRARGGARLRSQRRPGRLGGVDGRAGRGARRPGRRAARRSRSAWRRSPAATRIARPPRSPTGPSGRSSRRPGRTLSAAVAGAPVAQSARLPQAQNVTLLDPPLSEVVESLQRKRPVWPIRRRPAAARPGQLRRGERSGPAAGRGRERGRAAPRAGAVPGGAGTSRGGRRGSRPRAEGQRPLSGRWRCSG